MLLPQQNQPLPRFDRHLLSDVNVEIRTGVRVHGLCPLKDDDLPFPPLPLNKPRFGALRKVEILPQPVQTMQPVMQINRNHPHRFHRVVANPQQR